MAFGEVYTEGTLIVEQGSIADVLAVALDQPDMIPRWAKLQWWLRYLVRNITQFNPRSRSKNNVARN
jgi:cyclopropane-fatty-acyl-phospholipid synthase